jgi:hypothetical protein
MNCFLENEGSHFVRTATRNPTRKTGPPPLPRRRINQPAFYNAVRYCGRPGWLVGVEAGLTHQTVLSNLIRADTVPDSPLQIQRLQRIAEVVGFDREQLFVDGGGR